MKVLVCAYACLRDPDRRLGSGGEGVLGWNIVKQLARFHRVFVLTSSQVRQAVEDALKKESMQNVEFYYIDLPRWLRPLGRFGGGVQLYAYLWQLKAYFVARNLHRRFLFDVFHHVTYANDWMASFLGAFLPVPYIRGPGGGADQAPRAFLCEYPLRDRIWERLRAVGQWGLRHDPFFILGQQNARAILLCNRGVLEAIPQKWRHKAHLFPVNGISARDSTSLTSVRTPSDGFRVLSAGKLLAWKGFIFTIRAFKAFAERCSQAKLTLIGDGPELPRLESLVHELDLTGLVCFKKWMPRDEFLAEMYSYDVFLYPSLREGGGAVVVEAMAAGRPVVCLDTGGPGFHVTNECGMKIVPHYPQQAVRDMAAALERLYKDRELCLRMGRAARERAEQVYQWDRLGTHLLEIYEEALGIRLSQAGIESET